MNYKKGDRVVRLAGIYHPRGTRAIIISKDDVFANDYVVHVDRSEETELHYWHKNSFVLEELYDSPLYKIMEEE